jgi:hypothetical protein
VPATVALKQPVCVLVEDAVIKGAATRTTESIRPSLLIDRLGAPSLSAQALKEFWKGYAVLKLDSVEGHGANCSAREIQFTGLPVHMARPAQADF